MFPANQNQIKSEAVQNDFVSPLQSRYLFETPLSELEAVPEKKAHSWTLKASECLWKKVMHPLSSKSPPGVLKRFCAFLTLFHLNFSQSLLPASGHHRRPVHKHPKSAFATLLFQNEVPGETPGKPGILKKLGKTAAISTLEKVLGAAGALAGAYVLDGVYIRDVRTTWYRNIDRPGRPEMKQTHDVSLVVFGITVLTF